MVLDLLVEQNLRKNAKSLYIFPTTPDEVEKYVQSNSSDNCIHCCNVAIVNIFDPELQLTDTKSMIKSKLKNCSVSWKNSDHIGLRL